MSLLMGIDEGTSAVKAVLFDADLRPVKEARREKALMQPKPGWVEQDPEEVLAAVADAVAELLRDAPGEIAACGLDHQGESVLAWDADSGRPLTPIVTWQDKRSQEVLDRLEADGRADEVRERSGMPLDPYFSAGKLTWLLEHDAAVARALDAGTLRLGTVDSFLCDRLGAGFATDPATASRRSSAPPSSIRRCSRSSSVPAERCPRSRTRRATSACCGTTRGRSSCRCGRAAPTSRRRSPGQAASSPGWRRRPTAPASSCSPTPATSAPAERRAAADGRLADRGPGRVGARWRRVHRRGPAGVAQSRPRLGR